MKKLSWWNRTLNYIEDFEQKYSLSFRPEHTLLLFFIFWLIHNYRARFVSLLPDPINVFNYIGNVDSVIPALLVGFLVGYASTKTLALTKKQTLALAVIAGTFTGLICNILIEIPFGMRLINQPNVGDPLDVVWGTTFCLIACLVVFTVKAKDVKKS